MAVPDFQSMMLPFLQFAADREEVLPSGNQPRLGNRVGWCRSQILLKFIFSVDSFYLNASP
jgi:hypothetical protein